MERFTTEAIARSAAAKKADGKTWNILESPSNTNPPTPFRIDTAEATPGQDRLVASYVNGSEVHRGTATRGTDAERGTATRGTDAERGTATRGTDAERAAAAAREREALPAHLRGPARANPTVNLDVPTTDEEARRVALRSDLAANPGRVITEAEARDAGFESAADAHAAAAKLSVANDKTYYVVSGDDLVAQFGHVGADKIATRVPSFARGKLVGH